MKAPKSKQFILTNLTALVDNRNTLQKTEENLRFNETTVVNALENLRNEIEDLMEGDWNEGDIERIKKIMEAYE